MSIFNKWIIAAETNKQLNGIDENNKAAVYHNALGIDPDITKQLDKLLNEQNLKAKRDR